MNRCGRLLAAIFVVALVGCDSGGGTTPTAPKTTDEATSPASAELVWPQSSLEEVRRAQELADAGDPRYTWQVDLGLQVQVGQHHPDDAEIFGRFLEEELGWANYRWDETAAHPDGLENGDVVFIRCAPGETDPMYPDDLDAGCAPTLDELRYETVKINVAQLVRHDTSGIWVVTGWEEIEPFEQVAPPSEAEIAALLEPFLQARIEGEGARRYADLAENDSFADVRVDREIPLLYATSTGAPYERSEFEIVDGPVWPGGQMEVEVRLFAENGRTVVEQAFSLERDRTGRLRLVYDFQPRGAAGPHLATTENGKGIAVEYGFLNGLVTYRAIAPLTPGGFRGRDRVAIHGRLPNDDAPRRVLLLLADPWSIGKGCVEGPAPADAEALARSIGSNPHLEATAPAAVTVGGAPALQMDVVRTPGSFGCSFKELHRSTAQHLLLKYALFGGLEDRARLWLVDLPGGSARVLAIAVITDDDSFEPVLEYAAPIVDSIEFHPP